MHTSPPLCWENSRDTCVESRGKKRRTVKFHGGGGNTVGLSLMFENLSFNIVRAGENTGGKTTLEAACTREVKLNGRRRELPGNWKLGCERRTGRHEPLSPRHARGRQLWNRRTKEGGGEGSNINSRYFAWRGRNIRSIVRRNSVHPSPSLSSLLFLFYFSSSSRLQISFSRFRVCSVFWLLLLLSLFRILVTRKEYLRKEFGIRKLNETIFEFWYIFIANCFSICRL